MANNHNPSREGTVSRTENCVNLAQVGEAERCSIRAKFAAKWKNPLPGIPKTVRLDIEGSGIGRILGVTVIVTVAAVVIAVVIVTIRLHAP